MSFAKHIDYRPTGDATTLSVASAGGSAVSTAVFGVQVRAVQLAGFGTLTSTSGIRVKFADVSDSVVSSTANMAIPVNVVVTYKVSPGQRVSAIANDAATYQLVVQPLTD
jgi:hypothetical protein